MPKFGSKSKQRLSTCHEDLIDLFNEVIKYFDCSVLEGHRNEEDKTDIDKVKFEAPPNPALFTERITTPEEKEEIARLRQEIDSDEAFKLGLHLHDDEIEEIEKDNK